MHTDINLRHSALELLKRFYGYDSYRDTQYEVIEHVMQNRDCLVLMPTGGGKSICYQMPALLKEGCAIVVSPLLALMKDQVDMLRGNGIPAAAVNSMQTESTNRDVMEKVFSGKIKLLYISPERLLSEVERWTEHMKISLIAVDEAHCISQWGHDFRPEYTKLAVLKSKFKDVPFMALTATADKLTREDIVKQLGMTDAKMFISSFDRPNISMTVMSNYNDRQKEDAIFDFLDDHKDQSGIIYCLSRASTEKVADALKREGYNAECYHAGLSNDIRQAVQQRFLNDETEIICATIAFGMGIDKSNIRWVIHYNMPKNLECYYQEIGRAGRDGLPADALMFYSYGDVAMLTHFVEDSGQVGINKEKLQRMQEFAEAKVCRRRILLSYFNERFDHDCHNCDVCKNPPLRIDGTELVQMALSAIARMNESEGQAMVIDVLRGMRRASVVEKGYEKLKTFGVGANLSNGVWSRYLLQMLQLGLVEIAYSEHNHLKISQYGWDVLKGKCRVQMSQVTFEPRQAKSRAAMRQAKRQLVPQTVEERIIYALKSYRAKIAQAENVPPYIVFTDKTLTEIARQKPIDLKGLQRISGIGEVKLVNYGRQLIGTVRKELGMNAMITGFSDDLTYYLVDKKYDIKTMAAIKGVKPATIAGQIAKGIQLKKIDSDKYQRFIDREDYSRIVRLFQDGKLQLGTENVEDPIKVVIALAIYRLHFPNLKQ